MLEDVTAAPRGRQKIQEDVFAFVDAAHRAVTIAQLNTEFRKLIRGWGFDRWSCLQISSGAGGIRHPLLRHFGGPNIDWLKRYREAGHIHSDAAAKEILRRSDSFWWSDFVREADLDKRAREVFGEAGEFGANEGLATPIRMPDGSVWSCLLVGQHVDKSQTVKDAVFMAVQFYAARGLHLRERQRHDVQLSCRLTDRQRQFVEHLRYGRTAQDIATMHNLSYSTVHNTISDAKERFGVLTTVELVAEALLNGEIGIHPEL